MGRRGDKGLDVLVAHGRRTGSSNGRAASTNALLGFLGALGEMRQSGPRGVDERTIHECFLILGWKRVT
jgi:hypothetical protein